MGQVASLTCKCGSYIHQQVLRPCFRAFGTSPVKSLYVDAHKPTLGARHAKLSMQYASKIKLLLKIKQIIRCLITNM